MKKFVASVLTVLISTLALAGKVDTISVYSKAMKTSHKAVVITPDSYKAGQKKFETVYLLHGHGGSFSNWAARVNSLPAFADLYQLIIVCPEGLKDSWYVNSPLIDSIQFETFVAEEVPAYIDSHYRTITRRSARAITGLSMGGHGGMYLGFKHASFFGACGGMSGAYLLERITSAYYGVPRLLGDSTQKDRYRAFSIFGVLDNKPADSMAVIIDCGNEDPIVEMSRQLHQQLLLQKLPHTYIERPGGHNWKYWAEAVQYQLLFFRNYFDQARR